MSSTSNATLADEPLPLAERARVRRSYTHAAESSLEAAILCSQAAGGAAVFESAPFARALRTSRYPRDSGPWGPDAA
ncbi:MAG: hypothetical protein AB7F94_14845, partial [Nitrospira sp.]